MRVQPKVLVQRLSPVTTGMLEAAVGRAAQGQFYEIVPEHLLYGIVGPASVYFTVAGMGLVAVGVLVGLGLAAGAAQLLSSLLYGTSPLDPVAFGGRRLDISASVGVAWVPAGTDVYLSPYVLHRTADYWPEPERFDPDRFTKARSAGRPPLASPLRPAHWTFDFRP